jgi:hypothetical protein
VNSRQLIVTLVLLAGVFALLHMLSREMYFELATSVFALGGFALGNWHLFGKPKDKDTDEEE